MTFHSSDSTKQAIFTLLPPNYREIRQAANSKIAGQYLMNAILLIIGGVVSYGWWFYQDVRYLLDGATATAKIDNFRTEVTRSSSRGSNRVTVRTTNIIDYHFEVEAGKKIVGEDGVKTWRHKPSSQSGLEPEKDADVLIEYLKSSPNISRIIIGNRYDFERLFSYMAIIAAGLLLLFRFINSLGPRKRLQSYGALLLLLGFLLSAGLAYIFVTGSPPSFGWRDFFNGLGTLLVFFVFLSPFLLAPFWYGWILISGSRYSVEHPSDFLTLANLPQDSKEITVLQTTHAALGTDGAIIYDATNRTVHFINSHVSNGFIPSVKHLFSSALSSLEITDQVISTKQGKKTQVTITSPQGKSTLYMDQPGVAEFVAILQSNS